MIEATELNQRLDDARFLIKKGAMSSHTVDLFKGVFKNSGRPESLVTAFCAAAVLDYAQRDEKLHYKMIGEYPLGKNRREALFAAAKALLFVDIEQGFHDQTTESTPDFFYFRALYFFSAEILANPGWTAEPEKITRLIEWQSHGQKLGTSDIGALAREIKSRIELVGQFRNLLDQSPAATEKKE